MKKPLAKPANVGGSDQNTKAANVGRSIVTVIDRELGKVVDVSPQKQGLARHVDRQLDFFESATILGVGILCGEDKVYQGLGFGSESEFYTYRGWSPRTGRRYKKIGLEIVRSFNLDVKSLLGGSMSALPEISESMESLNGLGVAKLEMLTSANVNLRNLAEDEKYVLQDGSVLELDELKAASVREARKQFQAEKKKYQSENAELKQEIALMKAEADASKKDRERAEQEKAYADQLKEEFGERRSLLVDKRKALERAEEELRVALRTLKSSGINIDDPAFEKARFRSLIESAQSAIEGIANDYAEVMLDMERIDAENS